MILIRYYRKFRNNKVISCKCYYFYRIFTTFLILVINYNSQHLFYFSTPKLVKTVYKNWKFENENVLIIEYFVQHFILTIFQNSSKYDPIGFFSSLLLLLLLLGIEIKKCIKNFVSKDLFTRLFWINTPYFFNKNFNILYNSLKERLGTHNM